MSAAFLFACGKQMRKCDNVSRSILMEKITESVAALSITFKYEETLLSIITYILQQKVGNSRLGNCSLCFLRDSSYNLDE